MQYCLLPEIGGVGFVLCDRVILNDLLTNVKRFFVKIYIKYHADATVIKKIAEHPFFVFSSG